ncbi:SIS domain-containing protein [Microvirga mediterraneensis]|uniref:SIS domain-containing protein n=1 Tax=Microvirga mediterraneensis TaxID=2754695 RepID=A0A838BI56_9HYPH|nr:SIS domain-containing protein [Microvirga mediterraneensis]MBA1154799.1 SIS domain-containing protein [Microvirga mediterraneensis]
MNASSPTAMLREAFEAPEVVARLLASNAPLCRELGARLRASPPPFAVTCARGSSDNAATFVKYLLEIQSGLVTASVGPSVTSVYAARPRMRDALFLAVSQSGRSPDILNLAQAGRDDGALTVALVNDTSSPLAATCEVVLPLHAGPEKSVAATKSFIAALAAGLQLVAHWSQDRALLDALDTLPDVLAKAAATDWSAALPALTDADNLFVVGRGVGFAVAQEAALKLKETSGVHAEAMSAAELMHGPWTLAGEHFPILVLSQRDETLSGVNDLVTKLAEQGVPVLVAGAAEGRARLALPGSEEAHPYLAPLALIQSFYPLVNAIALARGRNPDSPPRLRKVTETV